MCIETTTKKRYTEIVYAAALSKPEKKLMCTYICDGDGVRNREYVCEV